jgi:hypothetical protein
MNTVSETSLRGLGEDDGLSWVSELVPGSLADRVNRIIRDIPDFPAPGVLFKDITPLLASAELFAETVAYLGAFVRESQAQ